MVGLFCALIFFFFDGSRPHTVQATRRVAHMGEFFNEDDSNGLEGCFMWFAFYFKNELDIIIILCGVCVESIIWDSVVFWILEVPLKSGFGDLSED